MGMLLAFSVVLISVVIVGVQCHEPRQTQSSNTQTNLTGSASQRLFAPINAEGLLGLDRQFMISEPNNAQAQSDPAGNPQPPSLHPVNPEGLHMTGGPHNAPAQTGPAGNPQVPQPPLLRPVNPAGLYVSGSPLNAPAQSGPVGNRQPILPRSDPAAVHGMVNRIMNMSANTQKVWAEIMQSRMLYPGQFIHPQIGPMGYPQPFIRYRVDPAVVENMRRTLSSEQFRIYVQVLQSRGILPTQFSNIPAQNNIGPFSMPPSAGRWQDNIAGPPRKMQRTQDYAGSRRGNLRIQEPIDITSSPDESGSQDRRRKLPAHGLNNMDEPHSGHSQRELDLASKIDSQSDKGKEKMDYPSQHEKSAVNPAGMEFGGTSRQPDSAIQSSDTRSGPGLALAIDENSDYTRVSDSTDLTPEDLQLTLATKSNSNNTGN